MVQRMEAVKIESQNVLESSFQNVRKFAEVLYKCKLCTSLPSILTSEDSFLSHVNNTHLQDSHVLKNCPSCRLKFRTKEDLWAHKKLMHSDFASEDEDSSEENDKYEIAWQITTDHVEINGADSPKRKKSKRDKHIKRQKKTKISEEPEEDPHIVISHGAENEVPQSSPRDSASLLKLTNQIATDASPTGSGAYILIPSSTAEFGKYTKLIREGGNIVYFCQVCNWKSQMRIMFTEHCKSTAHLVKVTVAEQNESNRPDCHDDKNLNESSVVQKYGKRGHFMSFLDEKINYYINKRLSNESLNGESDVQENKSELCKESGETTYDSSTNEDSVVFTNIKKEQDETQVNIVELEAERNPNSNSPREATRNRRKRKITSRLQNTENEEDEWSDDSDSIQHPTVNKVSRQFIEIPKMSEKTEFDSQFKIEASTSHFSPLRSDSMEREYHDNKTDVVPNKKSLEKEVKSEGVKDGSETSGESGKKNVADYISKAVESEIYRSNMYIYRCSLCSFVCNDIVEYRVHFEAEHEPEQTVEQSAEPGFADCKTEQWKVLRIRELLPDILIAHPRGNVSRDLLLQKASVLTNEPEISMWGPACNRALRELFPDSLAQRKGKFKKTYFFGVAFIDQIQQEQESTQDSTEGKDGEYSSLRDMTQDMDKILQHLHTIVKWKGDLEAGVSRDDVLHILGRKIDDPEVQHWGVQCNRAIRILFPNVQMKRKGKFKTTVYFGVTFSNTVTKEDFASLTAPKQKIPKPVVKDDGIRPKITWRDAIRTVGGKAFTTAEIKKTAMTRGWGPLLNPGTSGICDVKETSQSPVMYMHDLSIQPNPALSAMSDPGIAPPNVTADMLNSLSPIGQGNNVTLSTNPCPQNMSLLRYHLTSDEFNMYYKFGADIAKSVWQSKDQLLSSKEEDLAKSNGLPIDDSIVKHEMCDNMVDEKSNDADDENSQSTVSDERSTSSPFFTQKPGNPNVVETEDGVMYIKQEIESDSES